MKAYIVAGFRSAVGKANKGGFRFMRSDDLAAKVIKHLVGSIKNFENKMVDDLIVGNAVPEAEQGMQMGRYISLLALSKEVPGMIINRYCGSGLEAIHLACARIHAGTANCIIAGGTESMSMVPMMGYKSALNYTISKEHPDYYLNMGLTAEELAKEYSITREMSDEFSLNSHQKAINAIKKGFFKDEIVPIDVEETYINKEGKKESRNQTINTDEGPRKETSLKVLSKLKPAFKVMGQVTAGNSSQMSDGAAFVLVMSEKMVKELKLEPIARMVSYATAGVEPRIMGIGPAKAIPKALAQAGMKLNQIEQIELNEAFAAQALSVIKAVDLDKKIVNVNGGAVALGHPLGMTGAKLSIQLINEMRRRKQRYGIVTACVGGGQGVCGIFENLT
jgi:acetyl-CoA acyltransferase